jgi:glycosyltransferase involved in cell wall biosynthesis
MTHYRIPIFRVVSEKLKCDFEICFGLRPEEFNLHMTDKDLPFKAKYVSMWKLALPGLSPLYFQVEEIRAALSDNYDVLIHTADFHVLSYPIATILAKLRGKKVIHWTHGTSRGGPKSLFKEWVRRQLHRIADGLLLYGNREYEFYKLKSFPMEKVFITHNSLYTKESVQWRNGLSDKDLNKFRENNNLIGKRVLIYTGRLIGEKRVHEVFEALPKVLKAIPNTMLVVIGEGPEKNRLKTLAERLKIDKDVYMPGPIYDEETIARFFLCSDLAVSPGYVGLMVNHAFVYGVPVVTNDNYWSHSPEVVMIMPGRTGAFFKDRDIDSMAEVIIYLLLNNRKLKEMSKECIRLIDEEYNENSVANGFADAISYVLGRDISNKKCTNPD